MSSTGRDPRVMLLMAQAMDAAARGSYSETIRLLTQVLQSYPNFGEAYHNRAMAYSRLGRPREALADFSHAIALDPHPSAYEQRGLLYYELGDRPSARRDWEQALRLEPRRTLALINLGWLAFEDGRYQECIDLSTRAIGVEPSAASAYFNRARAYHAQGNMANAFADLQKGRYLVENGLDTSNSDVGE